MKQWRETCTLLDFGVSLIRQRKENEEPQCLHPPPSLPHEHPECTHERTQALTDTKATKHSMQHQEQIQKAARCFLCKQLSCHLELKRNTCRSCIRKKMHYVFPFRWYFVSFGNEKYKCWELSASPLQRHLFPYRGRRHFFPYLSGREVSCFLSVGNPRSGGGVRKTKPAGESRSLSQRAKGC